MLSRIHFLHEILLNLLISCRKNKVVFLLLLLVHEVYIENQEPRIEKSDWSIQISYALNHVNPYILSTTVFSDMCVYRYEASAQDVENGVLRMHRTVNSEDVETYASHLPGAEVQLSKEDDIVYKKGVLSHASGKTSVKLLGKVKVLVANKSSKPYGQSIYQGSNN